MILGENLSSVFSFIYEIEPIKLLECPFLAIYIYTIIWLFFGDFMIGKS